MLGPELQLTATCRRSGALREDDRSTGEERCENKEGAQLH
jgi:hypothetical protein